jgi:hypothetical protein
MLLMGPNLLIFLWHSEWGSKGVTWGFIRDLLSHLWVGTAFRFHHAPERYAELADVARAAPLFFRAAIVVTGALCLLGSVRLATRARAGGVLLAVVLLPAPLILLGTHLRDSMLYERHVIFALPSLAILMGAGVEGLFARLRPASARAAATTVVTLACLGGYAWLSRDVRASLRSQPIQPVREAVLTVRPSLDPFAAENREIMTVSWEGIFAYYDPRIHRISEREELLAFLAEADRTGRELYVSYGRPWLARRNHRELLEMVEDEDRFELVAEYYGFEPRGLTRVHRYRRR